MDRSLLLLRLQRGCFAAVAAVAEDGTGGGDVDDDELLEEAAAAPPEAIGPLMGGCIDDAVTDGQSWGTAGSMPSGKASKPPLSDPRNRRVPPWFGSGKASKAKPLRSDPPKSL